MCILIKLVSSLFSWKSSINRPWAIIQSYVCCRAVHGVSKVEILIGELSFMQFSKLFLLNAMLEIWYGQALRCIGDLVHGHSRNCELLGRKVIGDEADGEPALHSILDVLLHTSELAECIAAEYVIKCFCEVKTRKFFCFLFLRQKCSIFYYTLVFYNISSKMLKGRLSWHQLSRRLLNQTQ